MPTTKTKEELQERAHLVRAFEAACKIEYPTADELNGRIALLKKLGTTFDLREMRQITIAGPVNQTPTRPGPPTTKR